MKTLHIVKAKKPSKITPKKLVNDKGWDVLAPGKIKIGWGETKPMAIALACYDASKSNPVSVRIHNVYGKFQEERTYPRSADPKKSKG